VEDLERLGDSPGFGYALLEILEAAGWHPAILPAFAGAGVLVSLEARTVVGDRLELKAAGESVAEVMPGLFVEASTHRRYLQPRAAV
jgi:hypothetical protein